VSEGLREPKGWWSKLWYTISDTSWFYLFGCADINAQGLLHRVLPGSCDNLAEQNKLG